MQYIYLVLSVPALGFTKLSFVCLYRRIFGQHQKKSVFNLVLLAMTALISAWTIAFFFTFLFACRGDFSAWWHSAISLMTHCPNTILMLYGLAVSDFATDVIIVLLPVPMVSRCLPRSTLVSVASLCKTSILDMDILNILQVWRLQMSIRRKFGVSAIFLLGLV